MYFKKILIFGDTKSVQPIGMGEEFLKELLLPSPAYVRLHNNFSGCIIMQLVLQMRADA